VRFFKKETFSSNPFRISPVAGAGCLLILLWLLALPGKSGAVTLKIATVSPEGSFWMEKMRKAAGTVSERTGGKVQIRFFPGGIMGDDRSVLRKIRVGQLQGGAFISGALSESCPLSNVYGLPLTFRSAAEVDRVRELMDPEILEGFAECGLIAFGIAEVGFAYLMTKTPASSVEEVRGKKLWIPDTDRVSGGILAEFGITPVPLAITDVRTGLQAGLIDALVVSPTAVIALQWHVPLRYRMEVPLVYVYGMLVMDRKTVDGLSPEHRDILRAELTAVTREVDRRSRRDGEEAIRALEAEGIRVTTPRPEDLKEWVERSTEAVSRMAGEGRIEPEALERLRLHLRRFREGGGPRREG